MVENGNSFEMVHNGRITDCGSGGHGFNPRPRYADFNGLTYFTPNQRIRSSDCQVTNGRIPAPSVGPQDGPELSPWSLSIPPPVRFLEGQPMGPPCRPSVPWERPPIGPSGQSAPIRRERVPPVRLPGRSRRVRGCRADPHRSPGCEGRNAPPVGEVLLRSILPDAWSAGSPWEGWPGWDPSKDPRRKEKRPRSICRSRWCPVG